MAFNITKYVSQVYNLHSNIINNENNIELDECGILRSGIFTIINYKTAKKFAEAKYFKKIAFMEAVEDAYDNDYGAIMIIADDMKFLNLEAMEGVGTSNICVLNPGDVAEDCIYLTRTAIRYIHNLGVDTSKDFWWDTFWEDLQMKFSISKLDEPIAMHKIDYIFTYVNNTDKDWQETYNQYNNATESYNKINRFRDWENLIYHVRGVAKFLPWINNIYMVVSDMSQVPSWIDQTNVKVVLHKDIIPEELLPTFNSRTIEMYIWNISNLAEYFLYGNDDMFVIKDMDPTMFFVDGKIQCKFDTVNIDEEFTDQMTNYNQACRNSYNLVSQEFDEKYLALTTDMNIKRLTHVVHSMLKSSCIHIHQLYREEIFDNSTRFRSVGNYNQYIFPLYDYMLGNCYINNIPFKYLRIDDILRFDTAVKEKIFYTICLNDELKDNKVDISASDKNKLQDKINNVFNTILWEQCKYEKTQSPKKTNKVAICAIAKLENKYIREWVEYHMRLGFNKIYLYDNNDLNGESFSTVIGDYMKHNFVEVINFRGKKVCQLEAYNHCWDHYRNSCDWIAFIDIDEFITLEHESDIHAFLNDPLYEKFNIIRLNWKNYTDSGIMRVENNNYSIKRFNEVTEHECTQSKAICKTTLEKLKWSFSVHIPWAKNRFMCNALGEIDYSNTQHTKGIVWTNAWINHYRMKTLEEFIRFKVQRGYPDRDKNDKGTKTWLSIDNFFRYNKWTKEKNDFAKKLIGQSR